jgi:hypothetical protein
MVMNAVNCSLGFIPALQQRHEHLLEAVGPVAHADHLHAGSVERREHAVQRLPFLYLHLQAVVVEGPGHKTVDADLLRQHLGAVKYEHFLVQAPQEVAHGAVLDDLTVIDDGDVAAQGLGFLEVMRGEDDRRALRVETGQELPHAAAHLDIHAGGRLIEDQQARLVDQGAGNHQAPLHAAGQGPGRVVALVPQTQFAQVLLGALAGQFRWQAVVAGLVGDDIEHLLEQVEVELLRHDADEFLGTGEVRIDIHTVHGNRPSVLSTREQMMPMVVDLPAPFGPSRAKKSPCCTSRLMPLSAANPLP